LLYNFINKGRLLGKRYGIKWGARWDNIFLKINLKKNPPRNKILNQKFQIESFLEVFNHHKWGKKLKNSRKYPDLSV